MNKRVSDPDTQHVLNQIIERSNEYEINLFLAFIDYEKSFDSLYHTEIVSALITQGINPQYVQLIEAVYKDSQARIILDQPGPFFPINRRVKQADPLSSMLSCLIALWKKCSETWTGNKWA